MSKCFYEEVSSEVFFSSVWQLCAIRQIFYSFLTSNGRRTSKSWSSFLSAFHFQGALSPWFWGPTHCDTLPESHRDHSCPATVVCYSRWSSIKRSIITGIVFCKWNALPMMAAHNRTEQKILVLSKFWFCEIHYIILRNKTIGNDYILVLK